MSGVVLEMTAQPWR